MAEDKSKEVFLEEEEAAKAKQKDKRKRKLASRIGRSKRKRGTR